MLKAQTKGLMHTVCPLSGEFSWADLGELNSLSATYRPEVAQPVPSSIETNIRVVKTIFIVVMNWFLFKLFARKCLRQIEYLSGLDLLNFKQILPSMGFGFDATGGVGGGQPQQQVHADFFVPVEI
jgi:hypothetical protein